MVSFNPNQNYELLDFLPPAMQALANKIFQSSNMMVSLLLQIALIQHLKLFALFKNKNLKLKHRFFIPDRWNATDLILDAKYGQSVSPSQIRPYDVLYYTAKSHMGMNTLQHTPIYLSDDLVFKKTDAMENGPKCFGFFIWKVVGVIGFEPTTTWSQTRYATRLRYTPTFRFGKQIFKANLAFHVHCFL